jgi:hypothetical protein
VSRSLSIDGLGVDGVEVVSQDSDRVLYRTKRRGKDGGADAVLVLVPTVDRPSPSTVERLKREYELRHELALAGAIRPLELASGPGA